MRIVNWKFSSGQASVFPITMYNISAYIDIDPHLQQKWESNNEKCVVGDMYFLYFTKITSNFLRIYLGTTTIRDSYFRWEQILIFRKYKQELPLNALNS